MKTKDTAAESSAAATYTPGPWEYCIAMVYDEKGGGLELNVDESATGVNIAIIPPMVKREDKLTLEMRANARLIAAAPELLSACENALRSLEEICVQYDHDAALRNARLYELSQVIKKAKGQ